MFVDETVREMLYSPKTDGQVCKDSMKLSRGLTALRKIDKCET